jgi:hypothetical protein
MSVTFNVKPITNEGKWKAVKSGDFLVLEPVPDHPIPAGLYRAFILTEPDHNEKRTYCILPLFDGTFAENMFPYTFPDQNWHIELLKYKLTWRFLND